MDFQLTYRSKEDLMGASGSRFVMGVKKSNVRKPGRQIDWYTEYFTEIIAPSFYRRCNLRRGRNRVEQKKPSEAITEFRCDICLSSFTQRGDLKKHIERIHEDKLFKCVH